MYLNAYIATGYNRISSFATNEEATVLHVWLWESLSFLISIISCEITGHIANEEIIDQKFSNPQLGPF